MYNLKIKLTLKLTSHNGIKTNMKPQNREKSKMDDCNNLNGYKDMKQLYIAIFILLSKNNKKKRENEIKETTKVMLYIPADND